MSEPIYKIVGSLLGVALIVLSVFLKEREPKKQEDS